jgi:hypothetical protein
LWQVLSKAPNALHSETRSVRENDLCLMPMWHCRRHMLDSPERVETARSRISSITPECKLTSSPQMSLVVLTLFLLL